MDYTQALVWLKSNTARRSESTIAIVKYSGCSIVVMLFNMTESSQRT